MTVDFSDSTSVTLLQRLCRDPDDQAAWEAFVARYGGTIERWCRGWGLQPTDAQDVTQNVLLELHRGLRKYQSQPSAKFRGWLKTVAHRAWCDYVSRKRNHPLGSGDSDVLKLIASVEAQDDFLRELEKEADREILALAVERVRRRVEAHTWEAFRLMTYEELSGPEVAERLHMKVGTVWVAKSKVQRMLFDECSRLDSDLSEPS